MAADVKTYIDRLTVAQETGLFTGGVTVAVTHEANCPRGDNGEGWPCYCDAGIVVRTEDGNHFAIDGDGRKLVLQ
jgi:hypothetical protein